MFAQFRTMIETLAPPARAIADDAGDDWDANAETESDRSPAAWEKALEGASNWRPC